MSDKAGYKGKVAVSTNGGSSYSDIAGVQDLTFKVDQETFDVTDHDSGPSMEHIVGRRSVTCSLKGNYDEADTGQEAVMATGLAFGSSAGSLVYLRFRPDTASGSAKEFFGQASVTSAEVATPNSGAATFSFEFKFTGSITRQTQPA